MAAVATAKYEPRSTLKGPASPLGEPLVPGESVLKDTFEVHMRRIDERFVSMEKLMDERFSKMQAVMESNFALVNKRFELLDERMEKKLAQFDAIAGRMEGKVNALDARLDTLQSRFAWNLAWVGIIMGLVLAVVQRIWK